MTPNNGMLNSHHRPCSANTARSLCCWLGDQQLVIYSLAIAMVWQAIGYYMVMYMACMASMPGAAVRKRQPGRRRPHQRSFSTSLFPLMWTNIRTTLTLLYHLHHQHGVPVRQGHDLRRPGRRHRGHSSAICTSRHTPTRATATAWPSAWWCSRFSFALCCHRQRGDQARAAGILRRGRYERIK